MREDLLDLAVKPGHQTVESDEAHVEWLGEAPPRRLWRPPTRMPA